MKLGHFLLTLTVLYSTAHIVFGSKIRRNKAKNIDAPYQLYYHWKTIDYDFPSESERLIFLQNKDYIPQNVIITSMKIFKNKMFITTPRFLPGIPSTVNEVPYNCSHAEPKEADKSPKLKPFPSWDMQELSNCSAFQLIQSMEIDQYGRMWLADSGRTAVLDVNPVVRCPAKLVVIDLKDENRILLNYQFPENVVSPKTTFMKDMNVACTSRKSCFVYISDLFDNKLIVFDHYRGRSWTLKHSSMDPDPARANFTINGYPTSAVFGISNSALSPRKQKFDTFYYSPIAGTAVYAISTAVLKKPQENRNLTDNDVTTLGLRKGQSDGWAMDNRGNLYFGNLPESAIYRTQTVAGQTQLGVQQRVVQSNDDLSWIDTFSFDNYGMLALTTNRFQLYATPDFNVNEFNFRVLRLRTKTSAYSWRTRMVCSA